MHLAFRAAAAGLATDNKSAKPVNISALNSPVSTAGQVRSRTRAASVMDRLAGVPGVPPVNTAVPHTMRVIGNHSPLVC